MYKEILVSQQRTRQKKQNIQGPPTLCLDYSSTGNFKSSIKISFFLSRTHSTSIWGKQVWPMSGFVQPMCPASCYKGAETKLTSPRPLTFSKTYFEDIKIIVRHRHDCFHGSDVLLQAVGALLTIKTCQLASSL